jgi:hypothetical protein
MMSRSCVLGSSIVMLAACAVTPRPVRPSAHDATSREHAGGAPPATASDDRGMFIDSAPLTLQIGLRVSGSTDGPLSDGDTVMSKDRIQVLARTTEDAHLYLAYCSENRKLAVFPTHGGIFTPAGETTVAPGERAALVVDDHQGSEALYVILSRAELASADPRLAEAIGVARPGEPAADCGPRFEAAVATSSPAESSAAHARPAAESTDSSTRSWPGTAGDGSPARRPAAMRDSARGATRRPPQGRRDKPPSNDDEPPLVTIERGMYVGQNGLAEVTTSADADGIAILRYRFKHVAAPRP